MTSGSRQHRLLMRSFLRVAACVAIVGQLAVMLGTIADGRDGPGMASHVEQAGTSIHYAHSDACGLCQVRSLQSMASAAPSVPVPALVCVAPSACVSESAIVADFFVPNPSRAPPI
jgi:hypothetical protein